MITFLKLWASKLLRFVSTRFLERGYFETSVSLEKIIFKLRENDVSIRRIARYGSDDFKVLCSDIVENRGAEVLDFIFSEIVFSNSGCELKNNVVFAPVSIDSEDFDIDEFRVKLEKSVYYSSINNSKLTRNNTLLLAKAVFFFLKDKYPHIATKYGEKCLELSQSAAIRRYLANTYFRAGNISKAISYLSINPDKNGELIERYNSLEKIRKHGFEKYPEVTLPKPVSKQEVVYLLHNSLPYFSGGYATRSNGIIGGIKDVGWEISAYSRIGFPNDTAKGPAGSNVEKIDGINYHLLINDFFNVYKTPIDEYMTGYGEALINELIDNPPKIIHAASFYMNGIAAVYAARKLGSKVVYEIRGLNELSKISSQPDWYGSEHYQQMVRLETQAANDADAVFTLTQALKDEFVNRGVDEAKITVLPNGVHSDRFKPKRKSEALAKKLKNQE